MGLLFTSNIIWRIHLTKKLIGILDYGSGNTFSVSKSLQKIGHEVILSNNVSKLLDCDGLILPGVGAFGDAANKLRDLGLDTLVLEYIETGKTLLGICVGMQLLLDSSSEFGNHNGLGIVKGQIRKIVFSEDDEYSVPVIGWREVQYKKHYNMGLGFDPNVINSFYFVHSYSAKDVEEENIVAEYSIGHQKIVAMIRKKNVVGVQFHPERSGEIGQIFLKHIFN